MKDADIRRIFLKMNLVSPVFMNNPGLRNGIKVIIMIKEIKHDSK